MNKPPIGVIPRELWNERRIEDLKDAIDRHIRENQRIPVEWIREYNDLLSGRDESDESLLSGRKYVGRNGE